MKKLLSIVLLAILCFSMVACTADKYTQIGTSEFSIILPEGYANADDDFDEDQIAYYFKTYRDLLNKGEIAFGEKVNFVVPTGNFGDILAGYFAMHMGLPVGKLVCASNENNVLSDFF